MKMKTKGKVYPSPPLPPSSSSSSSSSSSHSLNDEDSLSFLKLLPATILVLVSVLSPQDREVLAYLITRGATISSSDSSTKKNKSSRTHKPPVFDCECFDCYTSYWLRWCSSPNRELIHEIIEAYENHHHHLSTVAGEEENSASRNNNNNNKSKRGKKKDKSRHRVVVEDKTVVAVSTVTECHVSSSDESPVRLNEADVAEREPRDEEVKESTAVAASGPHKGLARKVLPDVLGLFNSNFWRLWNPNA